MGLLAYLFFSSIPAFASTALVESLIATALCSAAALYLWYSEDVPELNSLGGGVKATLCLWVIAILLFCFACWLRNIPLAQAITLPPSLWGKSFSDPFSADYWGERLLGHAMTLGPGATLVGIGTLARQAVISLSNRDEAS